MARSKSSKKPDPDQGLKLVGSDKQRQSAKRIAADDEAPKTLHFPEHTPWGERQAQPDTDTPSDILDSIEQQIDRAKEALDRIDQDADVLFKITDDDDRDGDTPAAA